MTAFNTRTIDMNPSVLLSLCREFEEKYDIYSPDFHRLYLKGEYAGIHDAVRWAGYWEGYLSTVQTAPTMDKEHGDLRIAAG